MGNPHWPLILVDRVKSIVKAKPGHHIPTPDGHSFGKGTHAPSGVTTHSARLRHWSTTVPNSGLLRVYLRGYQERLLVTSPKALSEILVSQAYSFTKPGSVKKRLSYITGNGLLVSDGENHKAQRKSLMPAFSYRHIKDLYPIFWSKAKELSKCLKEEVTSKNASDSGVIVVQDWASRATLDVVGLGGMDHDLNSLKDPTNSLSLFYRRMRPKSSRVETLFALSVAIFSTNALAILSKLPLTQRKQVQTASDHVRDVCRRIIDDKREKMSRKPTTNDVDIVSVALRSTAFTNENLVDQMMTFIAAGNGTTSDALQWAVYTLCKHQDIQTRLREEVRARLPSTSNTNTIPSADDLDHLPYLHAFCNEVLRCYPSVPSTVREAMSDTTVAGYHIPKGTIFTIAPAVTNFDVDLWGPDAATFNPERWMQEGCANTGGVRNHYGFLTFLHGPRSCIGSTFARSELACLVAAIVGTFGLELEEPDKEVQETQGGISAGPADGVRARFTIIEGW
ncbi:hypothetical protein H2202_009125 [Exophiala xenobiotica]|nr:hypothetical protein H2202_009125 [Exophiala xenobiotica]